MHYAVELYAFLFFPIFLWAIRRCDYLQDLCGYLHLAHHRGIQVIPILTKSFWGQSPSPGGEPSSTTPVQIPITDRIINLASSSRCRHTLAGGSCDLCWEKVQGGSFLSVWPLKGANTSTRQREVRAQGRPCSASAGPGLGELPVCAGKQADRKFWQLRARATRASLYFRCCQYRQHKDLSAFLHSERHQRENQAENFGGFSKPFLGVSHQVW